MKSISIHNKITTIIKNLSVLGNFLLQYQIEKLEYTTEIDRTVVLEVYNTHLLWILANLVGKS